MSNKPSHRPTTIYTYTVYGVTLRSDLPLQLPPADIDTAIYTTVVRGTSREFKAAKAQAGTSSVDEWGQVATIAGGAVYMRWSDWLEFIVSNDGRHIIYNALSPGPTYSFEAYLANFAVSAAMIQNNEEPLHTTVVDIGGRGVGLLGHSGTGKSTLAGFLLSRGGRLVTDDMLRVTFLRNQVCAELGPMRLKLLKDSADVYATAARGRGEWYPDTGKFLFEPTMQAQASSRLPLTAFIQLNKPDSATQPTDVAIEKLAGRELFKAITSSSMNSRIQTPERLKRQFFFAARLARIIPVYRITYPRRFDIFMKVAEAIDQCVADSAINRPSDVK